MYHLLSSKQKEKQTQEKSSHFRPRGRPQQSSTFMSARTRQEIGRNRLGVRWVIEFFSPMWHSVAAAAGKDTNWVLLLFGWRGGVFEGHDRFGWVGYDCWRVVGGGNDSRGQLFFVGLERQMLKGLKSEQKAKQCLRHLSIAS